MGDDEIEPRRTERQKFGVSCNAGRSVRESGGYIAGDDLDTAGVQQRCNRTPPADVERETESPSGIVKPVEHARRELVEHWPNLGQPWCCPGPMGGDCPAIEDLHLAHRRACAASAGWRKAPVMLKSLARAALDLLLPPQCLACSEEVPADGLLCVSCFVETSFITDPVCGQCGLPLAEPAPLCTSCDWAPPTFRSARAALQYNAAAKRLILPFKYADRPELAIGLARLLLRPGKELLARADLLVPVPLHRSRLAHRGYNQAGLLARALGRISGTKVMIDALVRLRATRPLSELDQTGRELALKGAIGIREGREAHIAGRTILLVDDVLTTGATASACADALYAAGAAAVDVLAIARVAEAEDI